MQHSRACDTWAEKYQSELVKDKESLVDHRKAMYDTSSIYAEIHVCLIISLSILDHLREAGWDDELEQMDERDLANLKTETEMVKVCQKPLTEKSEDNCFIRTKGTHLIDIAPATSNLIQHLDGYLTRFKEKRIKKERKEFLQSRIPTLRQSVEDYVLSIPVSAAREFPGVPDLFCHPLVRDFIDNAPVEDFERTRLEPLLPVFPDIVREVQSTIRDKAIALVVKGCGKDYEINPDTVLDLATTIFSCSQCRMKGPNARSELYVSQTLRFPDVMYHPCAVFNAYRVHSYVLETEVDFEVLGERTEKANWNRYSQISFKAENQKVLSEAVALSGLDPIVATSAQMDAADPIFECVACNDLHKGRAMMRWSLVVRLLLSFFFISKYQHPSHLVFSFHLCDIGSALPRASCQVAE